MPRLVARTALNLAILLTALPWSSARTLAPPPVVVHEPFPLVVPQTVTGACAFPVQQIVPGNREAATIRVDPDGTQHLKVRGVATVEVVNLNTGKSLDIKLSMPVDITVQPDGAQSIIIHGQSLLFFFSAPGFPPLPPGLVPGAYLTHGKADLEVSTQGAVISFSTTGQTTDICAALTS